MKYKTLLTLTIFLLLLLTGCRIEKANTSASSQITWVDYQVIDCAQNNKIKTQTIDIAGSSYDYGIYNLNGEYLHDTVSYYDSNDEIALQLVISNNLGSDHIFSMVILDNNKQIEYSIDNQTLYNCSLKINNNNEVIVPIKLANLSAGKHEIVFLFGVDSGIKISADNLQETDGAFDSAIRCTFIVDNDDYYSNPINYDESYSDTSNDSFNLFYLNDNHYQLEINNTNETKYATIIVFDNLIQISSYTIIVPTGCKISIPFEVDIDDNNNHELEAVMLYDTSGNYSSDEILNSRYTNRIQF